MTRRKTRKPWHALALGTAVGAAGTLGGCRSAEPIPDVPQHPHATLYPGLRSTAAAPVFVSGAAEMPRSRPMALATPRPVTTNPVRTVAADEPVKQPPTAETIDLGVALRLAGVDNPTVNLAREQVREATAGHLAARSLLLPTVNVGGNFRLHRGPLQDDPGELRAVNLQSLYLGAGAGAVGANPTTIPGVRLFAHLGDAVYEPLAARQRVAARRSDAHAVQNQTLLDVAVAYLDLVGAEARLDILRRAEVDVAEIVRVTTDFARTGQGAPPDANRAAANADLVRRQLRETEGAIAAASARLCRLLNLDPTVRFRTPGGPVEAIRLVPEDSELDGLLATATRSRPELAARAAAVLEAHTRVRQERVRPLLPTLSVGYSAGGFGGGSNLVNSTFGPLSGRSDFDVVAVWTVQNLGLGNRARVRAAGGVMGQAVAGYDATLNLVRREVASAQADAQAAWRQIGVARVALSAAEEGYRLESERIKLGEGRPIEALDSFRQLVDARLELLRAVVAFDVAQFRLLVALGNNPTAAAECAPRGE